MICPLIPRKAWGVSILALQFAPHGNTYMRAPEKRRAVYAPYAQRGLVFVSAFTRL